MQFPCDLYICDFPLAQGGKLGKTSIVIQEQVQFDRPLGSSEMGPVKDAQAQVDGGRVETDQFVLKLEFLLSRKLASTSVKQVLRFLAEPLTSNLI